MRSMSILEEMLEIFATTVQAELNATLHVCESGLQDVLTNRSNLRLMDLSQKFVPINPRRPHLVSRFTIVHIVQYVITVIVGGYYIFCKTCYYGHGYVHPASYSRHATTHILTPSKCFVIADLKTNFLKQSLDMFLILLTYLHTPRSRVLLGKLTDSQLVKKFPAFDGTRRFITAFTTARQLSLL
jgi:hypothetical protein